MERNCFNPKTVDELRRDLALLPPGGKIIGGGTDLIVQMNNGLCAPGDLLYAGDIAELHAVKRTPSAVEIGAAATMSEIVAAGVLGNELGAVLDAASDVGSQQIRNRATIGGNIASASPAGDLLPTLFLLGAGIEVTAPEGSYRKPIGEIVLGPSKTSLKHNEVITKIILPIPERQNYRSVFCKLGFRKAVTVSRIGLAIGLSIESGGTVAFAEVVAGAISLVPVHVEKAENILLGQKITPTIKEKVGEALSELIMKITPEKFDRDYKVGAAMGIAEDALDRFLV